MSLRAAALMGVFAALGAGQAGRDAAPTPLAREMLRAHNAVRAKLKLRPLAWSERLARHARIWAETLALENAFFHRSDSPYGENLYRITGALATAGRVVDAWASEARDYDYRSNACRDVCGHYTQIVWRDTRRVGCAEARFQERQVWVCDYDPPGNIVGRRPY